MTSTRGLQRIGDDERLMFNELLRDVGDLEFEEAYPPKGHFFTRSDGDRVYWYYRGPRTNLALPVSHSRSRYVGPRGDPEIEARIGRPTRAGLDILHLRQRANILRQRGWTCPTNMEGQVLNALSRAGAFRLRSVLVGSVAYQAYSGLLGFRLPCSSLRTDDVDVAVDFGISKSIDDICDDIPAALRRADPSFSPRPHLNDHAMMATFQSSSDFQVEFLSTHRGSDTHTGHLSRLPSLGPHMGGVPLRYLDFLIREPVRSMILCDTGITVTVPAPERFAIHKLIVAACRRAGNPKILKDLAQATELIHAHAENGTIRNIESAWGEALARGASWRGKLTASTSRLESRTQMLLPH